MDATEALKKLAAEWKPKAVEKAADGPNLSKWEGLQKKAALGALEAERENRPQVKVASLSQKKLGGMKKEALGGNAALDDLFADAGVPGWEGGAPTPPPPPPMPAPSAANDVAMPIPANASAADIGNIMDVNTSNV